MKDDHNSKSVDLSNTTAPVRQHMEELFAFLYLLPKMMLMALWKKMLLKSAKTYHSDPWFSTHLSVLPLWKAIEIQHPSEFYLRAHVLPICGSAKDWTSRSARCFFFSLNTPFHSLSVASYDNVMDENLVDFWCRLSCCEVPKKCLKFNSNSR